MAGERLLEDALEALGRALDEAGAPWMIIGGIAVIAHGVRRFTTDVDAAILGDSVAIAPLLAVLARHGIAARVPDVRAFAEQNLVLLLRHEASGVDLDLSLAWSSFERDAIAARAPTRFGRVCLPMSAPDDLVVFKSVAGRPKDQEDVEALLVLHPEVDVSRARRRLRELAELIEAPELVDAFDAVAARARANRDPAPARAAPTKRRPRKPR